MTRWAPDEKSFAVEDCEVIGETASAILVKSENFPDKEEQHWIPSSQVHADSECFEKGNTGKLVVTHWLADKRGWE